MGTEVNFSCDISEQKTAYYKEKIFRLNINHKVFYLNELSCVEILVSLIRAGYEIMNIKTNKKYVFNSTDFIDFKIMSKEEYGLNIVLRKKRINCFLFRRMIFDFSPEDFSSVIDKIYDHLNVYYGKDIIDIRYFSPSYLENMLGVDLPNLVSAKYEKYPILDLELYNKSNPEIRMYADNHKYFKMLKSGDFTNTVSAKGNFLLESDEERFRRILSEISEKEQLSDKYYAIVYNNEMFVRDGMHRIACIYYLYGNIEIPVLRLNFSRTYFSYSLYRNNISGEKQ